MKSTASGHQWDQSTSAPGSVLEHTAGVFESFFEQSADAIWLFEVCDSRTLMVVDCNQAAVKLIGANNKQQLLRTKPEDLSPPTQPDGSRSSERTAEIIAVVQKQKTHRFEWMMRRLDGKDIPIEVSATAVLMGGKSIHVVISRDISERRRAERDLLELNQSLERRVTERTAALTTSEARLRAVVEHAPEAIVLFDAETGRFLFGNEHACRLYGTSMERLAALTPADVSPEFQAGGQPSRELGREKMEEALAGGTPVFEWIHQQPNGRLVPTEVRLLRLPSEGQNLIRASIIDNTERKRAEQALRESEEKFRALFEGSSQGVVLHDENELMEVNPAAVRIMGCQFAHELLGKNPREMAPPYQPNGESSDEMSRRCIAECLNRGSARFEWVARSPSGKDIPLEVALTRIQWSGRQVIQAFITDITERKEAESALREANRELHREIEQRIRAEELLKSRVRISTLNAEVAVALNSSTEVRAMLQKCAELVVRQLDVAFVRVWTLDEASQTLELNASAGAYTHLDGPHGRVKVGQYKIGLIAQEKKPHLTNNLQTDSRVSDPAWAAREGMVSFAGYPLLLEDRVLGVLAMFARRPLGEDILDALGLIADSLALGIERKRGQMALADSEARFSAAFLASPIPSAIARLSDEQFVLANDAFLNWTGYTRSEILGRKTSEFSVWERLEDRDAFWADVRRLGSIRERECRWRNHHGRRFTMLMSAEVIQLNHVPHLLCLALDITARKQTEAELRESEARLRESENRFSVAFQACPVFISIMRMSDQKYVLANDALVNWLGFPREKVLGRTSEELGMWDNHAEREMVWEILRTSGSVRQRECRWRNCRRELFTILLSVEKITLDNEPHVLSLAQDISQRKQAEVETLRALAREKELSQLKSNFVSMVSHEFRTPLGIIQSSAELLRDFLPRMESGQREEQLESITRNTRRMGGMMEEILVLSRLDAGKLDFQPAELDLESFCRRVVDEVFSATHRRCRIDLSFRGTLPAALADERLLGHIFTNLLTNAVKYSDPEEAASFEVRRQGAEAVCVIRDNGIGISEDDQARLFTAFHRGANVGNRSGTGLGLVLVKRCVELHRGRLHIESRLNQGTIVRVNLPVFDNRP